MLMLHFIHCRHLNWDVNFFKTEKALQNLVPIEKYYLSVPERKDCRKVLNERSYEIDTKLKLAKREFKTGLYIEEILK